MHNKFRIVLRTTEHIPECAQKYLGKDNSFYVETYKRILDMFELHIWDGITFRIPYSDVEEIKPLA